MSAGTAFLIGVCLGVIPLVIAGGYLAARAFVINIKANRILDRAAEGLNKAKELQISAMKTRTEVDRLLADNKAKYGERVA